MSYLCYSLDEAAKQLGMSETVLFRLSQFLKIPANAYDDVGYIAFNGDLSFSDNDLSFFRQVKERLLKGETLDTIKQRMKTAGPNTSRNPVYQVSSDNTGPSSAKNTGDIEESGINTIETASHLKKEADKMFNRYKIQSRPRLNQVFHNLAQQLTDNLKQGVLQVTGKPAIKDASILQSFPTKPLWHPGTLPEQTPQSTQPTVSRTEAASTHQSESYTYKNNIELESSVAPEMLLEPPTRTANDGNTSSDPLTSPQDVDNPWTDILQAANQSPRALNVRLRAAAQTLRQKALYQIQQSQTP